MRSSTVRLGVLAGVVVLAVAVAACSSGSGQGEVRIELRRRFREAVESGEPVDIGLLIAGDWERMVVVCPGSSADEVEDRLGFAWDGFPGTVRRDDEALLVFADQGAVVTWARVDRDDGDPCTLPDPVVEREAAVVGVSRRAAGLVLAPAA